METATLSELGRNVMLQFGAVSLALSTKTYEQRNSEDIERCRENIDAEQERFQLWAANLGLQTTGDRSLDYRVKDSASVKSYTKQLLEELGDDLVDCNNPTVVLSPQYINYPSVTKLLKEEPDESYTEQSTGFQEDEEDTDDEESRPCTDTELAEDDSDDTESENDSEKSASQDTGSVAPGATFEDIETMIDDISDIIDRLYRLASKLRNTATRAPPSARNFYREPLVDIDGSKFYLTSSERQTAKEQCEELHRQRIEELVRQSLRDECGDPFPKADNTPDLSSRTIAVIRRIAMANAYRQQQFAFWRSREWERRRAVKYQDTMIQPPPNLEEEELKMQEPMISPENKAPKRPTLEAPAKSRLVFSEVPSATWKMVKEPTLAALDETRSLSSKTEFTSSSTIYEPSGRKVGWPAFPKELGKKKDFICPYCFVTCPADYRGKGHWRAHLIQDLQPYTCLAENCQEGDSKLLNTWEEWIIHEQVHHRMEYSCPSHPEKTFPDRETYEYHVIQEHSNTRDELLTIDGCNNNANIAPRPRSGCPLCPYESDTWADLDKHLAYHLENLALLSLPLATGLERENVGMGSLQQEGGEDDAMNLLDEYVAGTLSNLFETECTEALEEIPSMPSEGLTQAALSKLPERNAGDEPTLRMLQNQDAPDDFHRFDPDTGVSPYDAMVPWDVEHIREIFPRASPTLTRRLAMANAKRRKRIDMIRARITQFRLLNKYDEATRERAILETKDPMLYGHFLAEAKRKFAKFGDVPGSNNKVTISDSFFQRLGGVQTHLSNFNGEDDVPGSVNLPTGEIFSSWDRESRSSKLKMKILEFAWISRHVTRFNKHYDVFRCPVCDSTLHDFSGRLASLDIISMLNHFKE
ncbi:hypothetical protein DM02DRAFT_32617 [Periconia macrospinosa]|uniref:C2H2-type domain-containing protein n=1 Tax=Periconia macrospinosa TaxID=97972 RepID=A0A2V1DKH4_9PLEO|nr:hypothetical protein DM02DRAFT_32617 [Periconia macrospinosa]